MTEDIQIIESGTYYVQKVLKGLFISPMPYWINLCGSLFCHELNVVFMKVSLFLAVLFISASTSHRAQTDLNKQVMRDWLNSGGEATASSNGSVMTLAGPAGKRVGDPYLDSTFRQGYVVFYAKTRFPDNPPGQSLRDIPVRLDLTNNEVEILTKSQGVRVAGWNNVQALGILSQSAADTSWFVNVQEYKHLADDDKASAGFFEQIATGRLSLLRYHFLYVQRANYNVALNVGSRDDEIRKEADWYVAQGRRVTKFVPGKKALISLMGDKAPEIEAYLKTEKPNLKKADELKAVFRYYNTL